MRSTQYVICPHCKCKTRIDIDVRVCWYKTLVRCAVPGCGRQFVVEATFEPTIKVFTLEGVKYSG